MSGLRRLVGRLLVRKSRLNTRKMSYTRPDGVFFPMPWNLHFRFDALAENP